MKVNRYLLGLLAVFCLLSCVAVKPHQRQYVGDPDMQMAPDAGRHFIDYVHSIRQGAAPAGGGKASGGCGCN